MSAPGLQAVQAIGGVVPPGLLARIQAGELTDKAGLDPKSYHLAGRETVRDAASRAWTYLRGAWSAWREFADAQPSGSPGTGAARDRWLLVILRELGYGQVPSLATSLTVDDREYPVSHAWQHIPIHLIGPGVDLDRRNPGVAGAARAPQAMLQELLNRSDSHLWAILSNGLQLRLLRDSTALAGSAYLEFDLESIFTGDLYPEFLLLWQLCHVSRLEKREGSDTTTADCWLEAWRGEAVDAGTRALDRLRDGVEAALVHLGTGFLRHPSNAPLVRALRDGTLTTEQYHRALLRLIYRLLFIFVTEDRDLLLRPMPEPTSPTFATASGTRERYARYFSTARLRRLSRIRAGSPHGDLWQAQRLVFRVLGDHGHDGLGLPALAGLFDPDPRVPEVEGLTHPDLFLGCELSNEDLLSAVRDLAWVELPGQRIQPVDYRNLGAEELGSVYESLLELVPQVELPERAFRLKRLAGNERKSTGSYYTPPSLVSALLESALDPLLDEASKNAVDAIDAETRLLALTVCDPACGSGHFLVAAARRIARRLAQVRSGEDEPTPAQVQHALRDVVGSCIYGVDINDLASELAKVSLWLEALEPGKPLGFLDARIRVGNSLLGVTPALLKAGVPDAAFEPIEGDDRKIATGVKKRNGAEAGGQMLIDYGNVDISNSALASQRGALLALKDDVDDVRAQAARWSRYESSSAYRRQRIYADAWCAAFVWPLRAGVADPPTDARVRAIGANPDDARYASTVEMTEQLAADYRFFHWHLEFPEILRVGGAGREAPEGWIGGFTCVLGNPPWDDIELKEQEFFSALAPEIAQAVGANRKRLIKLLPMSDPIVGELYSTEKRHIAGTRHLATASGRYPLTGLGRVKTDPLFAELTRGLLSPDGQLGIIVPTGIATAATTQHFFKDLVTARTLVSLYDFENEDKIFPSVHNQYRFALLSVGGVDRLCERVDLVFRVRQADQIAARAYSLATEEITLLNPNTGTCPVFSSRRDADIALGIYRRFPVLWRDEPNGNPWGLSFMQGLFNMASDSEEFRTAEELEADGWQRDGNIYGRSGGVARMLPLYEAKMAHHYDHRFSTYAGATQEQLNAGRLPQIGDIAHADPRSVPTPRYWVAEEDVTEALAGNPGRGKLAWDRDWLLGWRDICRSVDERTLISTVLPRTAVGHTYPIAFTRERPSGLQANLASFALDYMVRQKLSGTHMTFTVLNQLAMLPPEAYQADAPWHQGQLLTNWITARVLELTYTSYDIEGYARELEDDGTPFQWDPARRQLMRAELDAAYFHLYGIERNDVDYIMETFKVVRERDEKAYGEYRTKRLILASYDAMQKAIGSGVAYQTVLDPPPGDGQRHPARSEA